MEINTFKINDIEYFRFDNIGHWKTIKISNEDHVHILCNCGNDTFKIEIYDYEVHAICSDCGTDDVVYDG